MDPRFHGGDRREGGHRGPPLHLYHERHFGNQMIRIYNTLTGQKEEFRPIVEGEVRMYACGVTVYDHSHIGHARGAVVFDVVAGYLRFKGLKVNYVRNFTDIDDKIIKRAAETGSTWDAVAEKYTQEYIKDMALLGV